MRRISRRLGLALLVGVLTPYVMLAWLLFLPIDVRGYLRDVQRAWEES